MERIFFVSTHDLAEFLELTEKEIAGLTKRDVIPAVGKGQYNLFESIKAYIRHLRENAANSENRIGSQETLRL